MIKGWRTLGSGINRSALNLVVVCVDNRAETDFGGRFFNRYQTEPVGFRTIGELQIKMDAFFDEIGNPQVSTQTRSFFTKTTTTQEKRGRDAVQETEKMLEHKGDLATFVIHVQYRQNATWQGKIVWADRKSECNFRSALEMLKLMDMSLEQAAEAAGGEEASDGERPRFKDAPD